MSDGEMLPAAISPAPHAHHWIVGVATLDKKTVTVRMCACGASQQIGWLSKAEATGAHPTGPTDIVIKRQTPGTSFPPAPTSDEIKRQQQRDAGLENKTPAPGSATLITCNVCAHKFDMDARAFYAKMIVEAEGIQELGVRCPKCQTYERSGFISSELELLQKEIRRERRPRQQEKLRRRYSRKYQALQERMKDVAT